jgi:hypothetical protein
LNRINPDSGIVTTTEVSSQINFGERIASGVNQFNVCMNLESALDPVQEAYPKFSWVVGKDISIEREHYFTEPMLLKRLYGWLGELVKQSLTFPPLGVIKNVVRRAQIYTKIPPKI